MNLSTYTDRIFNVCDGDDDFSLIEIDTLGRLIWFDFTEVAYAFIGWEKEEAIVEHDTAVVLFFEDGEVVSWSLEAGLYDVLSGLLHDW